MTAAPRVATLAVRLRSSEGVVLRSSEGVVPMPANFSKLLQYAERVSREARRAADSATTRAADADERSKEVRTRVAELRRKQEHSWAPMRDLDVAPRSRARRV